MHISHVGLRVRDLDRSRRFYEGLGFTEALHLEVPDEMVESLVGLERPIGFEAAYMRNGSFVLQLLCFAGHDAPEEPQRTMVNAGLTHLSILVDDVAGAVDEVRSTGGTAPDDIGDVACMVRDPDGQLIELLDAAIRPLRD